MGVKKHHHPGKILQRDFMRRQHLSANALARALHVPPNRITGIINGERAVSADTAIRLAYYFDTFPEDWMTWQAAYDLDQVRKQHGERIKTEVRRRRGSP